MSSILTNNSAMVALQTLKSINNNLSETQSMISTGKSVASARDNSAVWAISKVMESDVQGFQSISASLSLGQSTVAVARNASETVTDLLTEMKGRIVAAQEENVDRDAIQQDIDALRDQIGAVVGAAQFNGLNLLSNTDTELDSREVNVLSSLDRSNTGVASNNIAVNKQDLGTDAAVSGGTTGLEVGQASTALAVDATAAFAILDGVGGDNDLVAGANFVVSAAGITDNDSGDAIDFGADVVYVARDGDTLADVTQALTDRLNVAAEKADMDVSFSVNAAAGRIDITNNTDLALDVDSAQVNQSDIADQATLDGEADGTVGGGLELLTDIDITSDDGADAALVAVESLIQTSIGASANFGSVQGRIDTQAEFISNLTDSLKSGIGTLVDANMEEASAKLQALQVQQQLAIQSLSIANQAPQSILSLFR